MFTDTSYIFPIIAIIIAAIGAALVLTGKKNAFTQLFKAKDKTSLQLSQAAASGFPPQLIDRVLLDFDDKTTITIEKEPVIEPALEIADDEETALLKAAEVVVEKVQDAVNHITSSPPNPAEVFTKIKSIVNHYRIFENTEYFEAINSFIAITVERDCGIQFTKDQLMELWV